MKSSLKPGLGNWVEADRFFDRDKELFLFLQRLREGVSISLVAQRRIGKTSLMRESARRLAGEIIALQVDLQKSFAPEDAVVELGLAARTHAGMWKRVLSAFGEAVAGTLAMIESLNISGASVTLRANLNEKNWKSVGDRIFAALADTAEKQGKLVVIFFDEVPILINRILKNSENQITPQSRTVTDDFMSWLRDNVLRHKGKVTQVITGSIGLEPILHQAGLSGTMNAYMPFELKPWDKKTAVACLMALADHRSLPLPAASAQRMVDLLECPIPHHVQMFFDHVHTNYILTDQHGDVSEAFVEVTYDESMIGLRGHPELSHMEERLRLALPLPDFSVALEILTEAAVVGKLTSPAAKAISAQLISGDINTQRRCLLDVLSILEHDGYLRKEGDAYVYVSQLIRDWWNRRFGFGYKPITENERK